jgi:hypothetical protein
MNAGPNIQHKPAYKGDAGFAFEDGQRVRTSDAEIFFDDAAPVAAGLDLEPFLDFLLRGSKTSQDISDRVLCLAYLMPGVSLRPRTFSELALWLDVKSSSTAKSKLEALLPIFKREYLTLMDRPRISEEDLNFYGPER